MKKVGSFELGGGITFTVSVSYRDGMVILADDEVEIWLEKDEADKLARLLWDAIKEVKIG